MSSSGLTACIRYMSGVTPLPNASQIYQKFIAGGNIGSDAGAGAGVDGRARVRRLAPGRNRNSEEVEEGRGHDGAMTCVPRIFCVRWRKNIVVAGVRTAVARLFFGETCEETTVRKTLGQQ